MRRLYGTGRRLRNRGTVRPAALDDGDRRGCSLMIEPTADAGHQLGRRVSEANLM